MAKPEDIDNGRSLCIWDRHTEQQQQRRAPARIPATSTVGSITDQAGAYVINNNGNISASHQGIGRAFGVFGGTAEGMTINNTGTITATRDNTFNKFSVEWNNSRKSYGQYE